MHDVCARQGHALWRQKLKEKFVQYCVIVVHTEC